MPTLAPAEVGGGAGPGADLSMAFVAVNDLERAQAFYVDTLGSSVLQAPSAQRPEVCVLRTPADAGAALSLTLVQVPTAAEVADPRGTARAADATLADEAAVQADIELSRVDDAVVDDAGLWRTPQGDVVTWFRDQAGGIASLAHRAA